MISRKQYQDLYNRVGKVCGWDFSHLKKETIGETWDFYKEVAERAKAGKLLLDIGTGGGERVLEISERFLLVIGIDLSKEMIATANRNLSRTPHDNVRFLVMDAYKLIFPNEFFDVVSCRHSEFLTREVFRVLKNGGQFLTQQVSEADKLNLKKYFGRGQSYGEKDGKLKNRYITELRQTGFKKVEYFDFNATEYYKEAADLVFLLENTPTIPNFGEKKSDFDVLNKFIKDNSSEKGIKTNSKRFMIVAKK